MSLIDNFCAIILAGGGGTRLWPLSRSCYPKQLLCFAGKESLLQKTARRLLDCGVDAEKIFTVTHESLRFEVFGQLHLLHPGLTQHILVEPIAKNTLPAVAWAVAAIQKMFAPVVVGVFPADHEIELQTPFRQALHLAIATANTGHIVTFGIIPTTPETGYGYIQRGLPLTSPEVFQVARFIEKPPLATAQQFLATGEYYWNGGIFIFQDHRFMEEMLRLAGKMWQQILTVIADPEQLSSVYAVLPSLSIDVGMMEQADKMAVVPVAMGWSDLGSWEAVYQKGDKDDLGNVLKGHLDVRDTRGSLLIADKGFMAVLGVDNLVVIQTQDVVLVAPRHRAQEVKNFVATLIDKGSELAHCHPRVTRPWGSYTVLDEGKNYKIKRLEVNPGACLSLQMHHHRAEHWVVVSGTARIIHGQEERLFTENESVYIPKTKIHRLENPGKIPLAMIEVQSGDYLGEDDIVRFDDAFGRRAHPALPAKK